jgi:hypothetical protein
LLNEQKKAGCAVIFVGEDLDVLLCFATASSFSAPAGQRASPTRGMVTKEEVGS